MPDFLRMIGRGKQNMKKYTALTKYLILLEGDAYGERDLGKPGAAHTPREERKTSQAGTVRYSAVVNAFIEDAEAFFCAHEEARPPEYDLARESDYYEYSSAGKINPVILDANSVLALLYGVLRTERYCPGTLLELLRDGTVTGWLLRLRDLDRMASPAQEREDAGTAGEKPTEEALTEETSAESEPPAENGGDKVDPAPLAHI